MQARICATCARSTSPARRRDAPTLSEAPPLELRDRRRVVRIRHPDQLWWPEHGIRKRDVVAYYREVAPALLPHLRRRPFTMKRHYNGPRSPFAWLKDAPPELPDWIPTADVPARSRRGAPVRYPLVEDELALAWMVDFGCVDFHVAAERVDRLDRPDWALFDLDAAGVSFADVVRAALLLRDALAVLDLESVVKTTGGEGLHVHVPLARRHGHEEVRGFCEAVSQALARSAPDLVTVERSPARRRGVYVDTKMVGRGQQTVAVYSVRPRPGAPVATPLRWEELAAGLDPRRFTMAAVRERLERHGDVFAPALRGGQRLSSALARLA